MLQTAPEQNEGIAEYATAKQEVYDLLNKVLEFEEFNWIRQYQLRFVVLMIHKRRRKGGRVIWGSIKVLGPRETLLTGKDILIELDAAHWDLNEKHREPILYHELCHLYQNVTDQGVTVKIQGHDIEEFTAVLRRYGDWREDMVKVQAAQMEFQFSYAEKGLHLLQEIEDRKKENPE
jgi:hypothetical protein